MKLIEYLLNGGTVFDVTYTWPEWLTSDIRTGVENLAMDYALRTIQPRVQLLAEMVDDMDLEDAIHLQVKNRILRNSYKYQTLLATEGFEYNPIENYNMAESTSRTFDKGAQQDSVLYGQDQTSTLHGHTLTRTHADTDTQTFANTDTTTTNTTQALTLDTSDARTTSASVSGTSGGTEGARIDNTTESVYGYNSSTASPAKDTQYSKGQQINSGTSSSQSSGSDTLIRTGSETTGTAGTVADAHTGTITDGHTGTITDANSGTDQVTRSQHTDQTTEGARRDAESITHTRAGNIGIMSTQDLIGQERAIADFSFLGVLTNDLINSFCLGVM